MIDKSVHLTLIQRQFGSQEKDFNVDGSDAKLPESQEGGWKQRESLIVEKFGGGGGGGRAGGVGGAVGGGGGGDGGGGRNTSEKNGSLGKKNNPSGEPSIDPSTDPCIPKSGGEKEGRQKREKS